MHNRIQRFLCGVLFIFNLKALQPQVAPNNPNPAVSKPVPATGKHLADYQLLYDAIELEKGKTKADLEATLTKGALSGTTAPAFPKIPTKTTVTLTYDMPDVENGTIVVTFASQNIQPTTKISTIAFQGSKPNTVK